MFFNEKIKEFLKNRQHVDICFCGAEIKLKKEYKIGIRVTVNRADLRKYLEQNGVIQAMNAIF